MKTPLLILASNSPRRRQLIQLLGIPVDSHAANVDESRLPGEDPLVYVQRLSMMKAQVIAQRFTGLILAADTIVLHGDEILGKPRDTADALAMLTTLRGRKHTVYTALSLLNQNSEKTRLELVRTDVWMRGYTSEDMTAYVVSGDPLDKAGAYAIQHAEFNPVERLEGCYASVMGLPLCHLQQMLLAFGINIGEDVPRRCQETLGITCRVYPSIFANQEAIPVV